MLTGQPLLLSSQGGVCSLLLIPLPACGCKQHMLLGLPVAAAWHRSRAIFAATLHKDWMT